jgi:YfiH family protein
MLREEIHSLSLFRFESFSSYIAIRHFVSTRIGGVSSSPYNTLNLGLHTGDNTRNVIINRRRIADVVGFSVESLTVAKQIHSGNVTIVSKDMKGRGNLTYWSGIEATDAMVTNVPNICLTVLVADCVPMVFYDPLKKVIGVAHVGRKGTVQLIARNTVNALQQEFDCFPKNIIVGIGPSIGPCCYKVRHEIVIEVERKFDSNSGYITRKSEDGSGYFDLWTANVQQLLETGIREENIEVAKVCTYDYVELFFSERYQCGPTGRFGVGIEILPA